MAIPRCACHTRTYRSTPELSLASAPPKAGALEGGTPSQHTPSGSWLGATGALPMSSSPPHPLSTRGIHGSVSPRSMKVMGSSAVPLPTSLPPRSTTRGEPDRYAAVGCGSSRHRAHSAPSTRQSPLASSWASTAAATRAGAPRRSRKVRSSEAEATPSPSPSRLLSVGLHGCTSMVAPAAISMVLPLAMDTGHVITCTARRRRREPCCRPQRFKFGASSGSSGSGGELGGARGGGKDSAQQP